MRVVFAHDHVFYKYNGEYYSNGGLSGDMLKRYSRVFEEVRILTRHKQINKFNDKLTFSSIQGTKFIEVPNFKSLKSCHKIFKAKTILEKEIEEADCVIARISSIGILAIEIAVKKNKPYIIEVVGCSWDSLWNYGSFIGKILAPYKYFKTKKLVRRAPYVIYVTKKFLQQRYPTDGKAINCSNVDISFTADDVLNNRLNKIEKNQEKIIFGTIGAVDIKYKGHDTMIKALSLIKDTIGTNFEYRIVGGGEQIYLENLSQKCGVIDCVKFEGRLPSGKEIFDFLDNIDVYVQPSRTEGLPRSVIEAMSRGCPVIGSDAGGIPELIDSDSVFRKSNSEELARLIIKIINDKEKMSRMAIRNFNESKNYYKESIESRRNKFLSDFRDNIRKSKDN